MIELDKIYCMDCREGMKLLPDNSVDAVVTDPPYFLINDSGKGFMGKEWDSVPKVKEKSNLSLMQQFHYEWAKEALRVLKPGGHLLSFGGTRTYHRMACAIEDAGFEIRNQIMWVFGQGFPKSLSIGKAIDKAAGMERKVLEKIKTPWKTENIGKGVSLQSSINEDFTDHEDDGYRYSEVTEPATPEAKRWEGFGTHLKPAHEPIVCATKPFNTIPSLIRPNNNPICMARKPLSENTIAENVLKWGTGGLNIDGSRVKTEEWDAKEQMRALTPGSTAVNGSGGAFSGNIYGEPSEKFCNTTFDPNKGRFPANLIIDGSDEVVRLFPNQKSGNRSSQYMIGNENGEAFNHGIYGKYKAKKYDDIPSSDGSASRFFKSCKWTEEDLMPFYYTSKAPKEERDMGCDTIEEKEVFRAGHGNEENDDVTSRFRTMMKNIHPTIKPLSLMEYLVKLITQPKGIVLDPFMGSGTTAIACKKFGFNFIGFEINEEYCKIAAKRLSAIPKRLDKFGGTI